MQDLLDVAIKLKKEYLEKGNQPTFKGKVLGMIFQEPSLRTRVSLGMSADGLLRYWKKVRTAGLT